MKKRYRYLKLVSISSLLLVCSSSAIAQYTNEQSNTITVNLPEALWSEYFGPWETKLTGILHTDSAGLQNFFQYCSSELNKDKGSFFTGYSTKIIWLDSTSQFFDSLDNKYAGLYQQYIASGGSASSNNVEPLLSEWSSRNSCNPACSNIGFQNGTLSYWSAFWAVDASTVATLQTADVTGGPCASVTQAAQDPNTKSYQVSLMPSTGTDPLAGPLIPYTPPLGGACAMVGDGPIAGAGVGMLEQTFTVSASNPLLTLQYAVMLENPNHPGYQQPWFQIQVMDENGNEIPGCGQYFVVSGPGIQGFIPVTNLTGGDTIYCKPWTTAFVPLNNYIGQCVTVIFTASDCALGGHYGYAYVAASCSQISLSSSSTVFCTGQRSATITGPPGGAVYQWTTTDGCIPGSSTQQVVQVTCGGTYRLVTSSFAGTECVDTFSITIPPAAAGPPPVPCFSVGDTICSGDTFHVNASCSSSNIGTKYYWDFYDNGQYEDSSGPNPPWSYIAGGNYNIRLHEVEANGCSADTVIRTVVESTANFGTPDITFATTNASSCSRCDGSITMTVILASLTVGITITDNFDGMVTKLSSNSTSISGGCERILGGFGGPIFKMSPCEDTCPGTYYYYIKPTVTVPPTKCAPGGFIGDTIPVTIGVTGINLAISQSTVPATCGKNNGSASITVSDGTAPYTYAWPSGLGSDSSVAGLKAGSYAVTVTDFTGCSNSATVTIVSLNSLSASAVPYYISCFGSNNGAIKIQPVGGSSPYTYNWLPNVSSTDSAGGLAPGNYSITVTDTAGCSGTVATQIIQPIKITDSFTGNYANVPCHTTGYATANASGGYPPYTFNWSNGIQQTTDTGLATGVYTLTITDANQCSITDQISVETSVSTGQIMFSGSDSICQGTTKVLTVPGDTVAVQWQSSASGNNFSNIPGATSASYTSTPAQTTYFRVYSPNSTSNCPDTSAVFQLIVKQAPVPPRLTAPDSIFCAGDSVQVCAQGTYASYSWNTGDTTPCTTVTAAGNYWVSVMLTDGCPAVSPHQGIRVYPVTSISIIEQGDTLSSFGAVSYQWLLNGTPISNATSATYVASVSGSYSVAVTDTNGCTTTSSAVAITGIKDLAEGDVLLFPNPSSGSWQLTVSNNLLGSEVEVYDAQGRMIWKSEIRNQKSEIKIDVAPGIYFLQLRSDGMNYLKKLVKE